MTEQHRTVHDLVRERDRQVEEEHLRAQHQLIVQETAKRLAEHNKKDQT